uniref:Uncharacterized protein n=1 Tax=Heliothis virescens TaxID=7102 RepID=A0A2A4J875_HELVI
MNRACISRFYTDGPAHLMLSLLTEDRQTVIASRELPAGDGGCLDINAPLLPNSKADLIVTIRYPEAQCVWERRVPLRIASGRVVVLSTERARYKPGELVRIRVLALRQDLAPSHGVIEEIWLEGPRGAWEGSRVTQWHRVRTRLGLAQLQYQLDELVPSGKWTLRARLGDGSQGSSVFWVGNYELPPFQLSVRHAPKVLRTSERLVWTVCVRYPWSEAVEGMLVIRLRGAGGGGGGIRTAVQLRAPKACHRHAAAAKRVGLGGADPPDVVVADFSFQEEGTRIWQNTTVVSQVVDKAVTLEFLTKHRAVISPGLPYKLKVKATRWDDKPAPNEMVRVCRYSKHLGDMTQAKSGNTMCAEGVTDANGVARLLFAAGDDAAPLYKFEAQLSNDTTISAVPLTLPVRNSSSVHAALGPLKAESRQARTFVPLYLHTNSTSKPFTVHFVVITRGGIIYRWGATTQCPTSSSTDQVHTTSRNSKCSNLRVVMAQQQAPTNRIARRLTFKTGSRYAFDYPGKHDVFMAQRDTSNVSVDISDALLERYQLRVMLPIKVSHQMCPDSHLIAYFYHEGELVSASKHFEMEECFANKVEATWLTRQAQPGSTVSLQVSTPGPALCGLSVLDTAAKWTQPPRSAKEQLMSGLRRLIDSHRNLTEYDAAGVCFLNNDTPDITSSSIELTASWMAAAGVRLIGGDNHGSKSCKPRPPALLVVEESTVARSDFSEAWLWRLLGVGSNGSAVASARAPDSITRFEAAAVCVSRNGIAMSNPAVLQVFREFFIHADSPKRLRKGDSTIIRYRIFNYLYEPLSVQVQILTDPHMEGPKDLVESACVAARSSIARRFEVRARVAAPARVSIRAKAVSDGNCGNITSGNTGVSDEVIIRIAVDPEGVPVREQKSTLLCGNSSKELNTSEVVWNWPPVQAVPGTETLTVWAVGDVTGPLLADADSLLIIPRGCGEQNMAQLATNLLALNQLEPTSIAALSAKENVARGFTRQLQYVHPSGGFSAFGPSDATSSTWLTAFVVRHLRKAHKLLWPNLQVPPAIIRAERWLLNQQMENGCFRNEGQVFHRELRGGLNDDGEIASVALTAYVITSLIDSASPLPHRVIHNTLSCLRAFPPLKTKTPSLKTRVYALSLLAYAYIKLERYEEEIKSSNEASLRRSVGGLEENEKEKQVAELLKLAKRSGDYDADSLLIIPRGCGEQNMAQLATNLLALNQLEPTSIAALSAKENVARGFTRQLQYVHPSGGFSAFGPSDATSSTWLTAFVVRHLRKAHKLLWPNLQVPPAIIRAERWLLNQQMENGCFRNEGQVFHRELRGGLNDDGEIASVALTAYVITSLIDSASPLPHRVIHNTLSCLRAFPPLKTKTPSLKTRVYALSLLAYAYIKLERYEEEIKSSNEASLRRSVGGLEENEKEKQVAELLKLAKRSGDYVWWEASSLSTSIEATSYALLALAAARDVQAARPDAAAAARWLNAHRTSTGGFISTQDTLVALEALTAWSSQAPKTHLNVTAQCSQMLHKVTLHPGVSIPDVMKIKPGERLSVSVEGTGCALIQATRAYNTLSTDSTPSDKQLSVQVSVHTDGPFNCEDNGSNCYCAAVIEACVTWTGSFPEMALLEVTLPGGYGADAQLLYSQMHKPTTLLRRIEVSPPSSRATFYLGTRDGSDISGHVGHQCYNIHATGPRVKTRPAYVRVQDYYVPSVNDTQIYTIPEDCLPRIVHESKEYRSSDNLYNKARSADSDEIVITHEYSFDDIPEGIPLEDPLIYDHITENDNYRVAYNHHENIGRLEKPKDDQIEDQAKHENNSFNVPPDNIITPKGTGPNQSNFDKLGSGYFSENDTPVANIEKVISKSIEKDNFAMISDGYITANGGTLDYSNTDAAIQHSEAVIADNKFDGNIIENVKDSYSVEEQSNFEIDGPNILSNGVYNKSENFKDNSKIPTWANNVLAASHVVMDQSINAKDVPEAVVENESKDQVISDVKEHSASGESSTITNTYQGSGEHINNVDAKNILRPIAGHGQSSINSLLAAKTKIDNVDIKNYHDYANQAVESPIVIEDKEINQHSAAFFNEENTREQIKQTVKYNKDESHFDTRNNIMREIDSLNSVAHKMLNETQKYDVHHIDYKQLYAPDDDDKVLNINNNQNTIYAVDNYKYYNEFPKTKENEVKRSSNGNGRIKPVAEKIIVKSGPDSVHKNSQEVDNPILSDFHVIDTEKDLEVPAGIEGPIPATVLPPPNFVPPNNGDPRRVEFKHSPFEGSLPDMMAPPPKLMPPTINVSRRQKTTSKLNAFADEIPMYDGLPPSVNIAPPPHNFRGMQSSYPAFPASVESRIATMQPPVVPTGQIKHLQSVYTPNGPYFYFKSENHALNKRYFIPLH